MTVKERNIVIAVLAFWALVGAVMNWFNPAHMSFVCQEDGYVEYSEAFLYCLSAAIFAYVGAHKGFRNLWYWGYAALFMIVCGEEVSWGQRIFDLKTPDSFAAVNVQGETNLHNIAGIHEHHHLYGIIVCAIIVYGIPLAARTVPSLGRLAARLKMPLYPLWTWSVPFIAFAFMVVPRAFGNNRDFKFDEMGELYLALAFFGFALDAYVKARPQLEPAEIELVEQEPMRRAA